VTAAPTATGVAGDGEEAVAGSGDPGGPKPPRPSRPRCRRRLARTDEAHTCGAGQIGFTVDPGRLQLCQLSRRSSFDLRDDTFARGWHEFLPALRARTWQSGSVCRACSLRPVCGSCPGAAELEHGDIEAAVAAFCEITHRRAHELAGAVAGHRGTRPAASAGWISAVRVRPAALHGA
jgi:radical SAM protein with 4Fe4S-binding SPASM domain